MDGTIFENDPKMFVRIVPDDTNNDSVQASATDNQGLLVKGKGILRKDQQPGVPCHFFVRKIENNSPKNNKKNGKKK